MRAGGREERTVKPIIAWDGYLFDHPARPARAPAFCPGCGEGTVDPTQIQGAIAKALRSRSQKHVVPRVTPRG